MSIEGKHALVTGGGTGIGLAITRALAESGATVTITGRRAGVLNEVAGSGIYGMEMDVRDENSVARGIAKAVSKHGPVQICVANAGIATGRKLQNTDMALWRNIMSTNLDGAFLTIRESMRSMLETDWGRVVTVASIAGMHGVQGAGAYSASKHALIGLTRSYSEDFMGAPYTFNALCPAYVDTPIVDRNKKSISERAGLSEEEALNIMVGANRHKRLIEPEEVAAAAMWLVGPGSSSVNGQCIQIAGGQF